MFSTRARASKAMMRLDVADLLVGEGVSFVHHHYVCRVLINQLVESWIIFILDFAPESLVLGIMALLGSL